MATDYKTRLTADTSQHDQALSKSAQQVYKYKKNAEETDKSMGNLVGKVGKFVKVVAAAKVASEGFNSVMKNNQTIADNFGSTMEVCKRISDEFFYSISKADFTTMINGLGSCISAANEYYKALDNLQTLQLGLVGENARLDAEMQNARLRVRQGDASAVADIERISNEMLQNVQNERSAIQKTLEKMIKSNAIGSGKSGDYTSTYDRGFSVEQVQRWLSNQGELTLEIERSRQRMNELKKAASEYNSMNGKHAEAAAAEAQYKALLALYDKMSDGENLQAFEEQYAKMYQLAAQYDQMQQRNLRYTKELGADNTPSTTKTPTIKLKAEFEEGSIADIEAQIRAIQDRLRNEVLNTGEAMQLQREIDLLELKKQCIIDSRKPIEKLSAAIEQVPTLDGSIIDGDAIAEELQKVIDSIQETGLTIDELKDLSDVGESIGYIGEMFSSLSDVVGDESGKIFAAIGSSISQIGQAIAKISSLMMAEGAASVMDLPYPANLAALATVIAAVTGVIGSIASIANQQFAEGGIVRGATTIGDFVPARLNAGEMVLNTHQQERLFRMLNNQTVTTTMSDGADVVFTIHGADLQGTLNNYNRKRGRVI